MKRIRVWCIVVVVGILFSLTMIAFVVCWQDPLFQYRAPEDFDTYYVYKSESYQNPGRIKNCQYDTLLTGSSMTENHDTAYAERKLGSEVLKASYSGANSRNATDTIRLAIQNNPELKRVLCSLDNHMFFLDWQEEGNKSPNYLTDDSILSDVKYWFNQDILYDYALNNWYYEAHGAHTNLDYLSLQWYGFAYGEQKIMSLVGSAPCGEINQFPSNLYEDNTLANLRNYWIPLIESTPWVEYELYFPPYSIMYWYETTNSGHLDATLYMFEQVARELLKYDNVQLYCFLDAYDVIANLYNYKDLSHYHFRINDWMIDHLAREDSPYQMTKDNISDRLNQFKEYINGYPYCEILNNPFRLADGAERYFVGLKDERYLCFAQLKGDESLGFVQAFLDQLGLHLVLLEEYEEEQKLYWICMENETVLSNFVNMHNVISVEIDHDDQKNQWIEIDGVPYGNNADGLNLVVWDSINDRVVDVVTYSLDGAWQPDRLNVWADYPWLRQQWQEKNPMDE